MIVRKINVEVRSWKAPKSNYLVLMLMNCMGFMSIFVMVYLFFSSDCNWLHSLFPTCNEVKADVTSRLNTYLLIIHYTLICLYLNPPILINISLLRDMNINNQECVHSKLSSIYHMPHHVKKYTNDIRPIFRCIWIKWKPEANKPASFLD